MCALVAFPALDMFRLLFSYSPTMNLCLFFFFSFFSHHLITENGLHDSKLSSRNTTFLTFLVLVFCSQSLNFDHPQITLFPKTNIIPNTQSTYPIKKTTLATAQIGRSNLPHSNSSTPNETSKKTPLQKNHSQILNVP